MQLSLVLLVAVQVFGVLSMPVAPRDGGANNVFTATKIYHTIIDQPPYLVDRTTVITWTQGPSVAVAAPTAGV